MITPSEAIPPAGPGPIPLCVPEVTGNELAYLKECIDTNFVSSVGPFVDRFEQAVAERIGTRYAVATVNGTAALHVALLLAGVKAADEVLLPTLTFIAPANAIRYIGAWPVFIDAEPKYWQIDVAKVADFLARECEWHRSTLRNRATGRRIAAILPVDILGHPVDLDPLLELARRYEIPLVQDATESLGALYRGQPVGRRADIACLSFNGNKVITTGGGGMIVTDNEAWARRARYLTTQAKDDALEFVHGELGFNYRLTNVLAAIGCAQLERLDEFVSRKRDLAAAYNIDLSSTAGITPMAEAPWAFSSCWLYTVLVDAGRFGMGSRDLLTRLAARNIQARPLWQPMHRSPAHAGCLAYQCEVADRLNASALSLPCSVGLTAADRRTVVAAIAGAPRHAQ